jgi:hypothetical protein
VIVENKLVKAHNLTKTPACQPEERGRRMVPNGLTYIVLVVGVARAASAHEESRNQTERPGLIHGIDVSTGQRAKKGGAAALSPCSPCNFCMLSCFTASSTGGPQEYLVFDRNPGPTLLGFGRPGIPGNQQTVLTSCLIQHDKNIGMDPSTVGQAEPQTPSVCHRHPRVYAEPCMHKGLIIVNREG